MNGLFGAWVAETAIVAYRAFRKDHRPPLPAELVAVYVLFGALSLVATSETARPAATTLGWGIVIATALNLGPNEWIAAASPAATPGEAPGWHAPMAPGFIPTGK